MKPETLEGRLLGLHVRYQIKNKELNQGIEPSMETVYGNIENRHKKKLLAGAADASALPADAALPGPASKHIAEHRGEVLFEFLRYACPSYVEKAGVTLEKVKKAVALNPEGGKRKGGQENGKKTKSTGPAAYHLNFQQFMVAFAGSIKQKSRKIATPLIQANKQGSIKDAFKPLDAITNEERKALFEALDAKRHICNRALNSGGLPKMPKISIYFNYLKKTSAAKDEISLKQRFIRDMGYDISTGAILSAAGAPKPSEKSPAEPAALTEDGKSREILSQLVDSRFQSLISSIREKNNDLVDCGKSHEEIYKILNSAPLGKKLVLFLSYGPDRLFSKALGGMGYATIEKFDMPSFHPLTGMISEGTHFVVMERTEEKCDAAPTMLANNLRKTAVVVSELHRLLDIAQNTATTKSEVAALHSIVDGLVSLLKRSRQKKLSEAAFSAFAKIEKGKADGSIIDPEIQRMALRKFDNPAIANLARAEARKEHYAQGAKFARNR